MNSDALPTIKPVLAPLIPPKSFVTGESAKPVGFTEDGKTIYEFVDHDAEATANSRQQALDADGNPRFRKDNNGNEYPVFKIEPKTRERRITLRQKPNGNIANDDVYVQSEEEKRREEMKKLRMDFQERWVDRALEHGLTPEQIIDNQVGSLMGQDGPVAPPEETEPELNVEDYPVHEGGGYWLLSNGEKMGRMNKAEADEAELRARLEVMDDADE